MSRAGSANLLQAQGAHSQRVNASVAPFWFGTVKSYDKATHTAVITIDKGNGSAYDTPPSPVMSPWWGQGYGDQAGPPPNAQALVAVIDEPGNLYAVLGFTPNNVDTGQGAPSDERWITDVRGSFIQWCAAGLRCFATGIASFWGSTRTEIGAEGLDAVENAVIRKSDLDAALVAQTAQYESELSVWASGLSGGSGVAGPTLQPVTSTGSSKVTAA